MSIDVRYIQQEHGKGCGLACATMIAGIEKLKNYDEAGDYHLDIVLDKGMKYDDINEVLKKCGAKVRIDKKVGKGLHQMKAPECLDKFKNTFKGRIEKLDAALLILIEFKGRLGHWVIYDRNKDLINDPNPYEQHSPIRTDEFIEHYYKKGCSRLKLYRIYTI